MRTQNDPNDWLTKDRSETYINRMADRQTFDGTVVSNLSLGINVYNNAISAENCVKAINTLESKLTNSTSPIYRWQGAMVTESDTPALDARDCIDFKISSNSYGPRDSENSELYDMHKTIFDSIHPNVQDYGRYWGVGISYYESFNFVKYEGAGKHFNIHADHGPAYVTTVSVVAYLNDDYEGGEIYFPRFDLTIKPKQGDVVVFPSTYIYEHASLPMKSGTKYSVVVMTDYNDRGGLRYFPYRQEDSNKLTY
jgi:2OG-Fe(II) oxygenase superfamily